MSKSNNTYRHVDAAYRQLCLDVLRDGERKENRTGVDTLSTFGLHYNLDLEAGFPLLTSKFIAWKNIVVEMLWFLSGQTDISILKRHGCKFWDAWVDEEGRVPSAYGAFWTNFPPAQEPEVVSAREPNGNDYVKPSFPALTPEKGHEWCGQMFESQKFGSFRVIRHVGTDAEGRGLFDIQFAATGYVKRSVRRDVIQQGTVRDRYAATLHGVGYYGERTPRTALDKDLLKVWRHMMDRCYDPKCKEFPYYGLKGVTVCKRWHNFANFHADCRVLPNWINKRDNPKKYALDKDFYSAQCYSPATCVWLSHQDNRLYAHAKAVRIEYPDGEVAIVLSATDAAAASKLSRWRVLACLEHGDAFRGFKFSWAEGAHRKPLPNNQIAWVLAEMVKNPMSRRMIVSAWAPGNAQTSKLPPCHAMFVFNVQNATMRTTNTHDEPDFVAEKIGTERRLCLHLTQRSCDVALGVPYNIASYALLMHIASRISGIEVGTFSHTLVDAHLYTRKPDGSMGEFDHLPGIHEQIARAPRPMPKLVIDPSIRTLADIEALMAPEVTTEHILEMFQLEGYDPHPAIHFKVAV